FKCDLGEKYCKKLSRPDLGSSIVTITTFNNEHNHEIFAKTLKFAIAYKTFSQKIMDLIEFYVIHGQYLENAIQKIKCEKGLHLSDAASLLAKLFELQSSNSA
ncbi:15163_t:CDS:2, partial [Dentiscutata heterogama]